MMEGLRLREDAGPGTTPATGAGRADSVLVAGVSLGLSIIGDIVAFFHGGRAQLPPLVFMAFLAAPAVLAFLNVYFVVRDAIRGRLRPALYGLALSIAALAWLSAPTWLPTTLSQWLVGQ
jgi:hypothetical protein